MKNLCFLFLNHRRLPWCLLFMATALPINAAGLFPSFPAVIDRFPFESDVALQKLLAEAAPFRPSPAIQTLLDQARATAMDARKKLAKKRRYNADDGLPIEPLAGNVVHDTTERIVLPRAGDTVDALHDDECGTAETGMRRLPSAFSPGVDTQEPDRRLGAMAPIIRPLDLGDVRKGSDIAHIGKLALFSINTVFNPLIVALNEIEKTDVPVVEPGRINGYHVAVQPFHTCLVARSAINGGFLGFIVFGPSWSECFSNRQLKLFNKYGSIMRQRILTKEEEATLSAQLPPVVPYETYIELIEVEPGTQGVGTALFQAMADLLPCDNSGSTVTLKVLKNSTKAISMYTNLGFSEVFQLWEEEDGSMIEKWRKDGYIRMSVPLVTLRENLQRKAETRRLGLEMREV